MDALCPHDLLSFYEQYFQPHMVDLSESSPPAARVPQSVPCVLSYPGRNATLALRRAVAARYETLDADSVVVTSGASEALAALALAFLGPGRTFHTAAGSFPTFDAIGSVAGGSAASAPDRADVLLLGNPTAPAGQHLDLPHRLAAARANGSRVVVDEVYRELALVGSPPTAACDIDDTVVSVGDLSKPLGLGGLRIGWVATRDRQLLTSVRRHVQLLSGGPAAPSIAMSDFALEHFDALLAPLLESARRSAAETYCVLRDFGWTFQPASAGLTVLARPPMTLSASMLAGMRSAGWFLLPSDVLGIGGGFRIAVTRPEALAAGLSWLERTSTPRADTPRKTCVVLTKSPASGTAKSRLAVALGADAAAAFAHAFVRDTLALSRPGDWRTVVSVPAPGADEWLLANASFATFVEQPGGNLGERIAAAVAGALEGCDRVALIGSDTPDLPRSLIEQAFGHLAHADLVVGPARDGGFYLLGAARWDPGLFADIEWSTETVCTRLLANAHDLGFDVVLLPQWEDVDDVESLDRLGERLGHGGTALETRAVFASRRSVVAHVS